MYQAMEKRAMVWLAVVLCVGLLLPNHYSPWLSAHQELAAAIAFAPLILLSVFRAGKPICLAWPALILILVIGVQFALGKIVFAAEAWMGALYLTGFVLAVCAGAQLVMATARTGAQRSLEPLSWLWSSLLLSAVLSVGLQAHQWLFPHYQGIYVAEIPPHARPFANLAQPNQLATLLLLGLAALVFLWESRKLSTVTSFAVAVWLGWGLVMTGSRSVLLAFAWLVPAFFFLRKRSKLRLAPSALLAFFASFVALSFLWPLASNALLLSLPENTALDRMASGDIRTTFWLQMLDAIFRKPWTGWGWDQVGMAQTQTALDHPATHVFFVSAHNVVLDLALWVGVPLTLLCVGWLAWWGWAQIRAIRSPQAWACLLAVGFVFSHAMVEYPLYYAYFLLPVGLVMGALSGLTARVPHARSAVSFWRYPMIVLAVIAAVVSVRVVWEYFPFEADWQLMRFQEARIGSLKPTQPPPAVLLTSIHDFLYWSRVPPAPGLPADSIEHIRDISERFAYAAPMYRLALAEALNGQTEAAETTLARLCRMQTEKACASALKEWRRRTLEFPQLADVNLPPSP